MIWIKIQKEVDKNWPGKYEIIRIISGQEERYRLTSSGNTMNEKSNPVQQNTEDNMQKHHLRSNEKRVNKLPACLQHQVMSQSNLKIPPITMKGVLAAINQHSIIWPWTNQSPWISKMWYHFPPIASGPKETTQSRFKRYKQFTRTNQWQTTIEVIGKE